MTIDKGIFIKNIYYMLSYAFNQLRSSNYEDIASEDFEDINDLFAEILTKGISYLLKQGLHKQYIEHSESLQTLRGRIDMPKTIENMVNQRQRLHCSFDTLSVNNIFNQIIKTAVNVLLNQPDVKAKRKSALRRLMIFFSEVQSVYPSTIKWNTLRYDRNSKTYQMLHYLCYFILDNKLLTTEKGKYRIKQFSDEHMNLLYEHFILEYYRKEHPGLHAQAKQIDWNIDKDISITDQLPILQTDIFLTIGERTLIIDAKYYGRTMLMHYNKHILHSSNVYQIYAYVTNHDSEHSGKVDGMLLYAKTEEEVVPESYIVLNDGNVIMFRTLDLNQPFEGIKAQLDTFVKGNPIMKYYYAPKTFCSINKE